MKRIKRFLFLLVIVSFSGKVNSQLWKQYVDSAKSCNDQKKSSQAIEYYIKAKRELQKDSAGTGTYARICNSLGDIYINTGKYREAESLNIEARQIREKVLGKDHADYASSCNNLGASYHRMGQYEKAEPLFIEAKRIREKVFGKAHSDYASSSNNLASLYKDMGQLEKAELLFIEAKQIREKMLGKEHPDYAATCDNLGDLYRAMGKREKAEPLFIEGKQIREKILGRDHPDYARSCNNLAGLYQLMGKYEEAESLCIEAKQIWEKVFGKEHPGYGTICNNLGSLYQDMGKYDKAEQIYLEAKLLREKVLGNLHPDYATSCNSLANLYLDMGQYTKAEPLFFEARQIWEKMLGKEHPDYAGSCNNLASLYNDMGQYEKAELLYIEAKQIWEKMLGKEHPVYAGSCNNLAGLYGHMGQYEKAELFYLEAIKIREKVFGKEHPDYAASCENLGGLYLDMGRYEKAELLCLQAKNIKEKVFGREHPDYATSCNNLASLYSKLGQFEKAEFFYLESREIRSKLLGKEHRDYASTCNNLGVLYRAIGQNQKAELLYLEAKQIREKVLGKEHVEYATSCLTLANLFRETDQYEKAEPLYTESKNIIEKALGKENPAYASCCKGLAALYSVMGQSEKAEPLYVEAKNIIEKVLGKEHPDYSASCNSLANLYRNMSQYERAAPLYVEALHFQKKQIQRIFEFTSEVEKQLYLNENERDNSHFFSFNYSDYSTRHKGFTYDVSLSRRNLILASSQQLRLDIYNTTDTSIKNKYNSWLSSRGQLSFWYSKPIAGRPTYVKDLEERTNNLEKELTLLSSIFKKGYSKNEIDWLAIQKNLKLNEAAVEFVEFRYSDGKWWTDSTYYMALILRKDRPEPEVAPLFEKKQLDSLLNRRSQLTQGGKNFIDSLYLISPGQNKEHSKSAYNLIWQPLEKHLKGITKIYFAPAGLLHRISFAAIPVNSKQVLSDKYQLAQLNTTASVVRLPVNLLSASDKIILYGGVKYDADSTSIKQATLHYVTNSSASTSLPRDLVHSNRGDRGDAWGELLATQEEINEIERLGKQKKMSLTLFDKINATEESFKSLNAKNSPAVLHVATHGFFFPDPKENKKDDILTKFETSGKAFKQSDNPLFRSGLLFAGANNAWSGKPIEGVEDGILTAYEVSNLYLPNTKLVVLSACETGLGDIQGSEGVYGLQRSFKMAGVQNLVMSLWKVPDEATSEFMQLFYQNMFNKQSISDAFYHAQTTMKNKYRNNPYNWAAWVLVR